MDNITLVSPSEYLARFARPHVSDRRSSARFTPLPSPTVEPLALRRHRAGAASRTGLVLAGAAVILTACSYGASLAWVLWIVRESGAEWMQHLIGEAG